MVIVIEDANFGNTCDEAGLILVTDTAPLPKDDGIDGALGKGSLLGLVTVSLEASEELTSGDGPMARGLEVFLVVAVLGEMLRDFSTDLETSLLA